ncbi:MAG TPA: hypothetical protein VMF56_03900 [Acidobacteriaceae bacterium]|nr:hypothetical protein [Acidobacteriaceae bacterium]
MATMAPQYADYPVIPARRVFSWSGIFAGTFVFLAIESTFGLLGAAIFASASNPHAAVPTTPGLSIGFEIWMVILSIIALYFAGKTSSKLLVRDANLGVYHGLVTFSMAVFSTVLLLALSLGGATAMATAHFGNVAGVISSGGEWWLFVAFVLSMLSAAVGGLHGARGVTASAPVAQDKATGSRNVA